MSQPVATTPARFERVIAFRLPPVGPLAGPIPLGRLTTAAGLSVDVNVVEDPTNALLHADRETALRTMTLRGLKGDRELAIDSEVEDIRRARAGRLGGLPVAIVTVSGAATLDLVRDVYDAGDYAFGIDLVNKSEHRSSTDAVIDGVAAALAAACAPIGIHRLCDAVYFFVDDKPYYVGNFSMGTPSVFVTSTWTEEKLQQTRNMIQRAVVDGELRRCYELVAASLELEQDRFRRFFALWTALEVLVNKLHRGIAKDFFARATALAPSTVVQQIEAVMSDKFRLNDRFAMVASHLRPNHVAADIARFAELKRVRDRTTHGQLVRDDALPVDAARALVADYLSAYLTGSGNEPAGEA